MRNLWKLLTIASGVLTAAPELPALNTNAVKLVASDGFANDRFGEAVAAAGETIAVVARNSDTIYVFVRTGTNWTEQARIQPPDGWFLLDNIALHEDTLAFGMEDDAGSGVAIYVRIGTDWIHQQTVLQPESGDAFGYYTLALHGDRLAVSASNATVGDAVSAGKVYVYRRSGTTWGNRITLTAPTPREFENFGVYALAMDDSFLAVFAEDPDPVLGSNPGAVHIFQRNGDSWEHFQKLVAPDRSFAGALFGRQLALAQHTLVAGAPFAEGGRGAVYVFRTDGTVWVPEAILQASNKAQVTNFGGAALATGGGYVVVGVPNSPAAYIFRSDDVGWTEEAIIRGTVSTGFGRSVAVASPSTIVITAPFGTASPGAAYVYGATAVDLVALEVVQVVQDWRNRVPLLTGKRTIVRAHFQSDGSSAGQRVTGVLHGSRDGVALPGSPLHPVNPGGVILTTTNANLVRAQLNGSLYFRLPPSWTVGNVELYLDSTNGPPGTATFVCNEPAEAGGTAADCGVKVTFEDSAPLLVKLLKVQARTDSGEILHEPTTADLVELKKRVVATFPTPVMSFEVAPLPLATNIACDTTSVLAAVRTYRLLDGCDTVAGCQRIYYAVLVGCRGRGGLANYPPHMAGCGTHNNTQDVAWNIAPHELGHTLGRPHAIDATLPLVGGRAQGYCGERAESNTPSFPFFSALTGSPRPTLGPMPADPDDVIWGFDTHLMRAIDPMQHSELMGYCGPSYQWPSVYTYTNLLSAITSRFGTGLNVPQTFATAQNSDWLLVRGFINLATATVQFLPFGKLTGSSAPSQPAPGNYSLQLLDADDSILTELSFTPDLGSELDDLATFLLTAPADPAIVKAVIRHNSAVIGTKTASAHPPTVQVLSPNGGETITADPVIISWQANDPDGDSLRYVVQYSPDGGATFETLVVDWPDTTFPLEHAFFAGSANGLIRVMASDGFHTATDESDAPFSVSNNPPNVFVLAPTEGEMYFGDTPIHFDAFALDTEDGELTGTNLHWTSSLDGALGTGAELIVPANQLSEGTHLVHVIATDTDGAASTASVHVVIARDLPAALADLTVTKNAATDTVAAGNNLSYTITVHNQGPAAATGITLTDVLPANVTLVSAMASHGNCNTVGNTITCNLGALASGTNATATVVLKPSLPGDLTNIVTVAGNEPDPVPANNATGVIVTVGPPPAQPRDLAVLSLKAPKKVTLQAGKPPKAGKLSIAIQNLGPAAEVIPDAATLRALLGLTIQSLGDCPAPDVTLIRPAIFPVTIQPQKKLVITYTVTMDCANDPAAGPDHADYRFLVNLNRPALDGQPDTNPDNNSCPRPPSGADKGCNKGLEAITDVIVK